MRQCTILVAVLLLAQVAVAGQNPDVRIHLDFDPPHGVDRIDPQPGDLFRVYIVVDCFGAGGGFYATAVAFDRTFGGTLVDQTNLLGPLDLGNVEDPHIGWVHGSLTCVYPGADGLLVTGYVTYSYDGPSGWIRILRTEIDQGAVADCNNVLDYFCIAGNAGVGMDAPPGERGCVCGATPVEHGSWGAIKALYR